MKETFIFEGKKFISSRRASQISNYSSDYIGQLCRAQKLDCRMFGRSWFVTEESLDAHQKKVAADEAVRNRIANIYGEKNPVLISESDKKTSSLSSDESTSEKKEIKVLDQINLKYESDDRPLLPLLGDMDNLDEIKASVAEPIEIPLIPINRVENKSEEKKAAFKTPVAAYPELTRKIILKRVIGILSLVFVIALGGTFTLSNKNTSTVVDGGENVAGVFSAITEGLNNMSKGIRNIFAGFRGDYVATKVSIERDTNSIPYSDENGMVVVPSTGIDSSDELIKMKIEQSFSDMVDIQVDENGNSGTVTPIFRESKGEDFMYVMVPVKDGKSP